LMGGKLGTIFARAGHEVVFSYARSRKKLEALARDAGGAARAGTPGEAAEQADALFLAVHWSRFDDVLSKAGDLADKVVVTCSLPMNADNTVLVVDPRRGLRSCRCRPSPDRPLYRAVRTAHRRTRVRSRGRAGTDVSVRTF